MATQEILDQLNAYDAKHDPTKDGDIWQDVILKLDGYDEDGTDALGDSDGTRFALTDGTVLEYSLGSGGGSAHSPHTAGWYEKV